MALRMKLKGNTLPEVLIALCITAFCSTLAVIIYLNIQSSTMPFMRLKANELAHKYLHETLVQKNYVDGSFTVDGYTIKKSITRNERYPDCSTIRIRVYGINHKQLNETENIIYDNR